MTSLVKMMTNAFEKDESHVHVDIKAQPYWNPYITGIGLGLVLLAAFVIMGRGLGASGAISTVVAVGVHTVATEHAANNNFYKEYLGDGTTNPFKDWLVFEVLGVIYLDNRQEKEVFSTVDLDLLVAFGHLSGIALDLIHTRRNACHLTC